MVPVKKVNFSTNDWGWGIGTYWYRIDFYGTGKERKVFQTMIEDEVPVQIGTGTG
jgi:hypothetical protein